MELVIEEHHSFREVVVGEAAVLPRTLALVAVVEGVLRFRSRAWVEAAVVVHCSRIQA